MAAFEVAFSLAFWSFVVLSSVGLFALALTLWVLTAPFDRRGVVLHRFTCFWASLYTWLNPLWPVSIEGREKLPRRSPAVLVANHASLVDILVLFRLFRHFKWVSKVENFRVPFIGWNMSLNRYIRLQRGSRASVERMFAACERALGQGSSVMMFPEGTRSRDGAVKPFKPGAFELAQRTRVPLVPIVSCGTAGALPKKGFVLRGRQPITVRVLDPIPYESFADVPAEDVAKRVRALIAEHLHRAQSYSPAS